MQNRYVGDVGDFGKYGLLRFLSGMTDEDDLPSLALGVAWYLHPDRCGNADGKFTGYLQPTDANEQYRMCDPALWKRLGQLVCQGARCTHCVQSARILPDNTAYHTALHQYWPGLPRHLREAVREHWLKNAFSATKESELVLLDPDNGIADEAKMFLAAGPRYTYLSDIRRFWIAGNPWSSTTTWDTAPRRKTRFRTSPPASRTRWGWCQSRSAFIAARRVCSS